MFLFFVEGKEHYMNARKFTAIYLNDHLAALTAAYELAKRSAHGNRKTALGDFLSELSAEIGMDGAELEAIMDSSGAPRRRAKVWAAWVGEKAGRLKLNGRIKGYADLSRLEELEALMALIAVKHRLWITLDLTGSADGDFSRLIRRAEAQLKELERHHDEAARKALGPA